MKAALEYTVDDLKDIIVEAWETGLNRGAPPSPATMQKMEHVYRESIKHDKPWGFDKTTKDIVWEIYDAMGKLTGAKNTLKTLVNLVEDDDEDD